MASTASLIVAPFVSFLICLRPSRGKWRPSMTRWAEIVALKRVRGAEPPGAASSPSRSWLWSFATSGRVRVTSCSNRAGIKKLFMLARASSSTGAGALLGFQGPSGAGGSASQVRSCIAVTRSIPDMPSIAA